MTLLWSGAPDSPPPQSGNVIALLEQLRESEARVAYWRGAADERQACRDDAIELLKLACVRITTLELALGREPGE